MALLDTGRLSCRRTLSAVIAAGTLAGVSGLYACAASAQQQVFQGGRIEIVDAALVRLPGLRPAPARLRQTPRVQPLAGQPLTGQPRRGAPQLIAVPRPVPLRRPGVATSGGLLLAASHGQSKAVEEQLKAGAALETRDGDGNTALMLAAAAGKGAIVNRLLDAGARSDAHNNTGQSALTLAMRRGHAAIMQRLLQTGALAQANETTRTMIERLAVRSCDSDMIRAAIAGDRAIAREAGDALLSIAAAHCDQFVMVELLTLTTSTQTGVSAAQNALFAAVRHGKAPAMNLLLGQGVDPNVADASGITPLAEAAVRGHAPLVALLLDKGASVDRVTASGNTALILAAQAGSESSIQTLIDNGAKLDRRNGAGLSALMIAARGGYVGIVQMLIEAGADRALRNVKRERAHDLAMAAGHTGLAGLLR